MQVKPYLIISGLPFALQTIGQFVRVVLGVRMRIAEMSIPRWPSAIGVFVTLLLCVCAFLLAGRQSLALPAADRTA